MPGEPLCRTRAPRAGRTGLRPGGRAAQPDMFPLKRSVIIRIPSQSDSCGLGNVAQGGETLGRDAELESKT